ncbi:hypothetical protein AGR1B_pTi0022 [Agrobacterium fabacearum S56]|uniref:Uncharacterized protein n=1 Tax=Agrobacterium deltaense Zutra 3/1 TaxID=1183427 RepID=A0A1S7S5N4_9HYPH|nr:hypothetical protein AGR1B_pTi0022 [Agrobacterium fabacearum S56]CUX63085.1 hypothetical protein AGR7C_pTi0079 [Agrobacterium deltaense Zutra 3/1]
MPISMQGTKYLKAYAFEEEINATCDQG